MADVDHTRRSTFAACIAHIVGVEPAAVPLDTDEQRAWLAERGLGLVAAGDPAGFSWPGPWIALRPGRDGSGSFGVVMFGVPSGAISDPAGTTDEVLEGFVVAPFDIAGWESPLATDPGVGRVELLLVAASAEAPVKAVPAVLAVAGVGLEGDRYAARSGTFESGRTGSALTLVDADVLDALGRDVDHRRNVVVRGTDLNALVGREFTLGDVLCRGRRLCEPCAHLDRLNGGGILRPLVHRGGLRADIVSTGTIRLGDSLTPG